LDVSNGASPNANPYTKEGHDPPKFITAQEDKKPIDVRAIELLIEELEQRGV